MIPVPPDVEEKELEELNGEDELDQLDNGPTERDKAALEDLLEGNKAVTTNHPDSRFSFLKRLLRPLTPQNADFEVPPQLADRVEFWKQIFTKFDSKQLVLHDIDYFLIYDAIDVSDLVGRENISSNKRRRILKIRFQQVQNKYHYILRSLAKKTKAANFDLSQLDSEELRIFNLFLPIKEPDKFLHAHFHNRIRAQYGMRDHFMNGIKLSGKYLRTMEQIFQEEGLPIELTRLPFIESSFHIRAHSRVGASGIWQFMRSTGKLFLRIDEAIDERRDPLESTRGAAKLLKKNYEILGSWPLAVTAYNHGTAGMLRAVEECNTADLPAIIRQYSGRRFGFASKNFYAEFLAALEVEADKEKYFGEVETDSPPTFDVVTLDRYLSIETLSRHAGIDKMALAELNPAFTTSVLKGHLRVPRNYPIRFPAGTRSAFLESYAKIPEKEKYAKQQGKNFHTVSRGDTLSVIARRYNTSISDIIDANALHNIHHIRVGQILTIPVRQ
ncbi:MAG: transglycosylase SLT domain-containing protein [Deltaproteobacteria bacterium]|nr:transglycosylase SLT domain-containing protein [Deltaproteobacteria bacterium]